MAQVTYNRHSFEKDFRHNDCRTHIQVYAATIEFSSHTAKEPEVVIRHLAQTLAGGLRMCMGDVSTNRHMDGSRHLAGIRFGEDAHWEMLKTDCLFGPT